MSELRRRAAFWRNLEHVLDDMSDSVEARKGDKCCDDNDLKYMKNVNVALREGLVNVCERYIEVLREQVAEEY